MAGQVAASLGPLANLCFNNHHGNYSRGLIDFSYVDHNFDLHVHHKHIHNQHLVLHHLHINPDHFDNDSFDFHTGHDNLHLDDYEWRSIDDYSDRRSIVNASHHAHLGLDLHRRCCPSNWDTGFPVEAILVGLLVGLMGMILHRRQARKTETQ